MIRIARKLMGLPPLMEEKLGCRPDEPDHRDRIKTPRVSTSEDCLITELDPDAVIDQGRAGSCAGCAAAHMINILTGKAGDEFSFTPSPLFIYYRTRELQGDVENDTGSSLRVVMRVLKEGVCDISHHDPYDRWRVKPDEGAFAAAHFKISAYERIPRGEKAPDDVAAVVSGEGLPVIIGISTYRDIMKEAGRTGELRMPTQRDTPMGGHAMLITGVANRGGSRMFRVLNSWGSVWGDSGYCWMPESYLGSYSLTFDLWTLDKAYW